MRRLFSRSCYFLGLACFIASLFFPTVPHQMIDDATVKYWVTPIPAHARYALNPLAHTFELIEMKVNSAEYGEGQGGDGYERGVRDKTVELLGSLPISMAWFMTWYSLFLIRRTTPFSMKIARAGGMAMLLSVPIMSRDFYVVATLYKGYVHLGLGACFIVGSFLMMGIGLLTWSWESGEIANQ